MIKRVITIVAVSLLSVALIVGLIVALILHRDSLIPTPSPAPQSSEAESKTESGTETESGTGIVYDTLEKTEGLEYLLGEDGESYIVVGMGTCKDKRVVIPESYEGKPVVAIGDEAFANSALEFIAIPKTVKNIGVRAFLECKGLQIFFNGTKSEWINGVEKADGWREKCSFSMIYTEPDDPSWEIEIG